MALADAARPCARRCQCGSAGAIPLSEARDRLLESGAGISAKLAVGGWTLLGLRLRGGFALQWPITCGCIHSRSRNGACGDVGFSAIPTLARRQGDSRALGLWSRGWGGSWPDGSLVRAVGEVRGWLETFGWGRMIFGPQPAICMCYRLASASTARTLSWPCSGVES